MESKNHNNRKRGRGNKSHIGRWILVFFALLFTFLPPLFRTQISANTPQLRLESDLLLTTFSPQVHSQICEVNNSKVGIGGIEVDEPSFETMFYTVQPGDTLYNIAIRKKINVDTVLSANRNVKGLNSLRIGQKLRIPNQKGIFHKVQKGQTITNIASAYKINAQKILEANNISKPENISAGKEIFIPGAKLLPSTQQYLLGSEIGFLQPVNGGWLSSGYGYRRDPFTAEIRFHTGVDIATYYGASIRASKRGIVTFSGWQQGYGNIVVIKHPDGYFTKYAHAMKNLVSKGDYVRQGQTIALVGSTGRSIGPHLHFEICKNGQLINPSSFISLPRGR